MLKTLFALFALLTVSPVWADFEQDLAATADLPQDFRELHARAEAGDANAQLNMGVVYSKGQQIAQDYPEAAKWFRLAARQGQAQAQYNLGVMYDSGLGVTQDHVEATHWYRLAADQGLAIAQLNLGVAYDYGEGVPKNQAEALKWLSLAANQGEAQAQFNLAVMYANGEGVARDLPLAYRWARLSAAQGHEMAKALLADLTKKMTPRQLASEPAEQKKSLTNAVPAAFYIQLGAFRLEPHAETRAENLMALMQKKLGDPGKPYRIFIDDDWVRIQIGPYSSLDEARRSTDNLKAKLDHEPLIKQY